MEGKYCGNLLNSIFDLQASLSNKKMSNRKPKNNNNNEKWFDEECKTLRKKLRNLSIQKQRHRKPEPTPSLW